MAWRSDQHLPNLRMYIYAPPDAPCDESDGSGNLQSVTSVAEAENYQGEDIFATSLPWLATPPPSPVIKMEGSREQEPYRDLESATEPGMDISVTRTPNATAFDEFCRQLRLEADAAAPSVASFESTFSSSESDPSLALTPSSVSSVMTGSTTTPSIAPATPCPRRALAVVIPHRTNTQPFTRYDSEDYSEGNSEDESEDDPIPRPGWIKTRKPSIPDNTIMLSQIQLRDLEYSRRHECWTSVQQMLICGLYRWYRSTDSGDWSAYTVVFNSITGLQLRERVVQTQFHTLRYNGPKAYPEYAAIWRTPFEDPNGKFVALHAVVEAEIRKLGLNLVRRSSEPILSPTSAARSKSKKYRRKYRERVKKVKSSHFSNPFEGPHAKAFVADELRTKKTADLSTAATAADLPKPAIAHRRSIPMNAMDQRGIAESFEERAQQSLSNSLSNDSPLSVSTPVVDCLAFRVWDANSRTVFNDDGFVADLFQDRQGPVTRPLPRNDEYGLFDVLAVKHLSLQGNTSAFVSVAASLLQAMKYTGRMTNPQCAVIALDHPDLGTQDKVHWTKDIIHHLRRQGEMKWARYRGGREYLSWGNIPMSCILHVFPLSELQQLCSDFDGVTNLLDLDLFTQGLKTKAVARKLGQKHTVLNIDVAKSMGQVARCFGLVNLGVRCDHIKDFVGCLVDGWSIQADVGSILVLSDLARHFAMAMGPSRCLHIQDVMAAFMEGVKRGSESLAYYSKIRSRSGYSSRRRS